MRRLNVRATQVDECLRSLMFAMDNRPTFPHGEELLLQLTKDDAAALGKLDSRIEFALIYDRCETDHDGSVSRLHWPDAGKVWKYILFCSDLVPAVPFSLDKLPLSRSYAGQTQAIEIAAEDETVIRPLLTAAARPEIMADVAGPRAMLQTIRNRDRIVRVESIRTTRVTEHARRIGDPWLGNALKVLYDHRCQVCTHDFKPRWGVPHADTRFLIQPETGGQLVSDNLVVICPNHNAIIGAAHGEFDRESLSFTFPNGLREKLLLRDHLIA